VIRNVTISNVIAHGQGTSAINGHPDSWLEGIRFNHVRLFVSHGSDAPYEDTAAAMTLRYARDVAMKDVELRWEEPHAATWQSGLIASNVEDLVLEGMRMDAAPGSEHAVLRLADSEGVLIRQSRVPSLHVGGGGKSVRLVDTDAKATADPGVDPLLH